MKILAAASTFALLIFTAPLPAQAGEVSATYLFAEPSIEKTVDGFSLIVFPSAIQAGKAGEPSYPFRGACILLPEGERSTGVRMRRAGWRSIGEGIRLHPRQDPVPGIAVEGSRGLLYNSAAYSADEWIEPEASAFATHYMRGHAIAAGSFTPVSYRPSTGEAGYWSEIEVTILTSPAGEADGILPPRTDPATEKRLLDIIDNDADYPAFYGSAAAPAPTGDEYEYLIVAREAFAASFAPLKEFYDRRGMRTRIMTVEEIDSGFAGSDTAERIRNAVIAEYLGRGITHLLLAGDGETSSPANVPFRGLYCAVQSTSLYTDSNMPSDIYFSALDGNWNGDGDGLWGEPGEEDFFGEIAVGRASIESAEEAAIFIEKTSMYQESPVTGDIEKALLLGEKLYNDPVTWGGDEMDQLVGTCDLHGFTTTGIDSTFDIARYYDSDLYTWSKTAVFSEVSAGTGWICHSGHSNTVYVMRLSLSDINGINFTNDGVSANFPIVYTYGCYAGAFDADDCIAERIVNIPTFASAIICHSRYGWFTEGTTNGPSHHFQREFMDAVFTEGYTSLGAALSRAKDETVPFLDLPDEYEPGAHRWCFYCLNLLGDPLLDGWTGSPSAMAVTHASCIDSGDTIFNVSTTAPGALASLYGDGVCFGRAEADGNGDAIIPIDAGIAGVTGPLLLTVTAHDYLHYRDTIQVDCNTPADIPDARTALGQNVPNPFNPSTVIAYSTALRGRVTLRVYDAMGREAATLVDAILDPGEYSVEWRPARLASGVYFYLLETPDAKISRKAVLLR